jgi:hypothetical protein
MNTLDRAAAIRLARNILANVPDSYTDEQLNDIGKRAIYWLTRAQRNDVVPGGENGELRE